MFFTGKGREHLKSYFDKIVAKGGEGVMLREPQSVYKEGASLCMRKYKVISFVYKIFTLKGVF